MHMNMTIIMTMNIYIKSDVEENLRRYDGSMSGLVNRLLEDFFKQFPSAATGIRRNVDKADPREPSSKKEVSKNDDVPDEPTYEKVQF